MSQAGTRAREKSSGTGRDTKLYKLNTIILKEK